MTPRPNVQTKTAGESDRAALGAVRGPKIGPSEGKIAGLRDTAIDPDLRELLAAWPGLPASIRVLVLTLIRTSDTVDAPAGAS